MGNLKIWKILVNKENTYKNKKSVTKQILNDKKFNFYPFFLTGSQIPQFKMPYSDTHWNSDTHFTMPYRKILHKANRSFASIAIKQK